MNSSTRTAPSSPQASNTGDGTYGLATPGPRSELYLRLLLWCFTFFNLARVVTYLPTMYAIEVSRDSSQHSLWTWFTWLAAHITMAAWLYEKEGRQFSGPCLVSMGNSVMCLITTAQIIFMRL